MNFQDYTIQEFNMFLDPENHITEQDTFLEFGDKIENDGMDYFYMSMDKNDVLEEIKNQPEIVELLGGNLTLIRIKELGYFIATF